MTALNADLPGPAGSCASQGGAVNYLGKARTRFADRRGLLIDDAQAYEEDAFYDWVSDLRWCAEDNEHDDCYGKPVFAADELSCSDCSRTRKLTPRQGAAELLTTAIIWMELAREETRESKVSYLRVLINDARQHREQLGGSREWRRRVLRELRVLNQIRRAAAVGAENADWNSMLRRVRGLSGDCGS